MCVTRQSLNEINEASDSAFAGDSITKDIKGWEISDRENKIVVQDFPDAKTNATESLVVLTIKQNPETIVVHCDSNDFRTEKDQGKIPDNILRLAHQCKQIIIPWWYLEWCLKTVI